jgi:hypothetical protein
MKVRSAAHIQALREPNYTAAMVSSKIDNRLIRFCTIFQ